MALCLFANPAVGKNTHDDWLAAHAVCFNQPRKKGVEGLRPQKAHIPRARNQCAHNLSTLVLLMFLLADAFVGV